MKERVVGGAGVFGPWSSFHSDELKNPVSFVSNPFWYAERLGKGPGVSVLPLPFLNLPHLIQGRVLSTISRVDSVFLIIKLIA